MLYLLYTSEDLQSLEKSILPLFEEKEYKMVLVSDIAEINFTKTDCAVTYLGDENLRVILPKIAENECRVGILSHPKIKYATLGLGISSKNKEVIDAIYAEKEVHLVDLFCCNETIVFQSVNIGEIFELLDDGKRKGIYRQFYRFFRQIRKLPFLRHSPFTISMDGEKVIDTSAIGIIAAEHSNSYLVAKRLISQDVTNDGLFHMLIFAPQNILQLVGFIFKSLSPTSKKIRKTPSFIGHIKASEINVSSNSIIHYTLDGTKMEARSLDFHILPLSLQLVQSSKKNKKTDKGLKPSKSLKIESLPTGENRIELSKRSLPWLRRASFDEFQELFKVLRENATLKNSYVVMMVLSTLITAFGLYANSSPVIIGGMILAPLISPIVSFSMGVVRYDVNMLKYSLKTIMIGTIASLAFAAAVSLIIPLQIITSEIGARLSPTLLDLGIAVVSGIAAAYAHAKEGIAKSLAGVAIAVALVPPLVVAGIGIGWWNWDVFSGAFLLYLTNLSGIIMFAGLTFLLLGFAPFKTARKGLLYSLFIIILVCIPLTFSFNRIKQEAEITKTLEGIKIDDITLREVRVRFGSPSTVSVRLVAPKSIEDYELKKIKHLIEEQVGRKINLEVSSAIEF